MAAWQILKYYISIYHSVWYAHLLYLTMHLDPCGTLHCDKDTIPSSCAFRSQASLEDTLSVVYTSIGFNPRFWLHCHFSFFDFSFLRKIFGNIKCALGGEFIFLYPTADLDTNYSQAKSQKIKDKKMQKRKNLVMAIFWLKLLHLLYYPNLNLQLDRNMNSPPIVHFRFPNFVLRKEKSKKEKWQCSQNLGLNPTYVQYGYYTTFVFYVIGMIWPERSSWQVNSNLCP